MKDSFPLKPQKSDFMEVDLELKIGVSRTYSGKLRELGAECSCYQM